MPSFASLGAVLMTKQVGFTLIELLIVVAIIGIIAAVAIPSLLRARVSANESAIIGDTRSVISAQAAYQSANGGYFDGNLSCLQAPASGCIPGYPSTAPTFLDVSIARLAIKSGYARTLEGGSPPAVIGPSSSTSVVAYAYTASPATLGQGGVRGFGGDSTGLICSTPDGAKPGVAGGLLVTSTCFILR